MRIEKEIDILIGKVISGNATEEEKATVENWKMHSNKNRQIFDRTLRAWEHGSSHISDEEIAMDKAKIQSGIHSILIRELTIKKRVANIYKIAAAVAIPIALAISLYFANNKSNIGLEQTICEVSSSNGSISKCVLPDGTEVWINSDSKLIYDANSFNANLRQVKLDGEAYFEVVSDKKNPFVVHTNLADVKVTGTSFNVKALNGSGNFEAILAEGIVELQMKNKQHQTLKMNPGERVVYNSEYKELQVQRVDVALYTSWRNGEIIFKDATLNDLIVELERVYGIQFFVEDENLLNYRFRGMFSSQNNLIDALEKINITAGLDYRVEDKKVWLRKSK